MLGRNLKKSFLTQIRADLTQMDADKSTSVRVQHELSATNVQALRRSLSRAMSRDSGQALMELAVFGSIFLLILGVLVNYGLRYNLQQRAQMRAFRTALRIATDPNRGAGQYASVEDMHVPDPTDMFGIGSSEPIIASASVTRDVYLDASPDVKEGLPVSITDVQTQKLRARGAQVDDWERKPYLTAGFRIEQNVPEDSMKKYQLIYGIIEARHENGIDWVPTNGRRAGKTCIESEETIDPEGNPVTICNKYAFTEIRYVDSCAGEVFDHDSCYNRARMIVDPVFCRDECNINKPRGSSMNCRTVCNQTMVEPWYAQGATDTGVRDGRNRVVYEFPNLEAVFTLVYSTPSGDVTRKINSLGLQPDSLVNSSRDETFTKTETSSTMTTDESADWVQTTTRAMVYNDNLDVDGYDTGAANPTPETIDSVISEGGQELWTTPK